MSIVATILFGCAGAGPKRPAASETQDEQGFTIHESARVGAGSRARFEKAMEMLEQEEYEAGIALLGEVVEAEPEVVAVRINLGIAQGRMDDLDAAEKSLLEALALDPRHPVAHNELGIVYRRAGRFAEARASYQAALDQHPDFHFARKNLAILCDLYLADPSCALEQYERYVEAVPDDEAVSMWIADLRNRVGR